MIDSKLFYSTYEGHDVFLLKKTHDRMRSQKPHCIFLAGDSSLDSKHWIRNAPHVPALNGYEHVLRPRTMIPDVSYWINMELLERELSCFCLNTAVEESTLADRMNRRGPLHDALISKFIRTEDMLVLSVGGNDIALKPTCSTMLSMASLMLEPVQLLGPWNPIMAFMKYMFKTQIETYIRMLTKHTKPRRIGVCFIYYPDETKTTSWANRTLGLLGYDKNPKRLQERIKIIYEATTMQIKVDGFDIVPIPLFEVLDGKCSQDYVQRVEPSVQGGHKMAKFILDKMLTRRI